MKKIILSVSILILGCASALPMTPVLFTLQTLTGTVNNRDILVVPDVIQNPLVIGTNLISFYPFILQPVGGQVQTNLAPWGYTIKVDGWPRTAHIVVPDSTSVINAATLINTNQFSPLIIYFSGGGSGSQTPWTSDIDAAGHSLNNANALNATSVSAGSTNLYALIIAGTNAVTVWANASFDPIHSAFLVTNGFPWGVLYYPATGNPSGFLTPSSALSGANITSATIPDAALVSTFLKANQSVTVSGDYSTSGTTGLALTAANRTASWTNDVGRLATNAVNNVNAATGVLTHNSDITVHSLSIQSVGGVYPTIDANNEARLVTYSNWNNSFYADVLGNVGAASFTGAMANTNIINNAIYLTNSNPGVVIDATTRYQLFVTNASYTITGFSGLVNGAQHIFSQTVSNSSAATIIVTGSPGTFYIGPISTNSIPIAAGKEYVLSYWIWPSIRTNALNCPQQ